MSKLNQVLQTVTETAKIFLLNTPVAKWLTKYKSETKNVTLSKAIGTLILSDTKKPLHNITVQLWDRDIGTPDDCLGEAVTDEKGYFEIEYDPNQAGFQDAPDLQLRILETRASFNANNELVFSRRLAHTIKGGDNVKDRVYDFGICPISYWLYDPENPFPRTWFTDLEDTPDEYPTGRTFKGYEVAQMYQPIKSKHLLENIVNPNQPFFKDIQNDYPPNLTIETEKKHPGSTRSDEFLGWRVLNGMNPCLLKKHKQNLNQYQVSFNWDAYEKSADYDLHNVEAIFQLKDDKLLPTAITIQTRDSNSIAPFSALKPAVTYTPADGEKWLQAKRIFRTNYFYAAELIEHYIKSHLQMEQYAIAAFRNLRKNPIRFLLIPHLKSLININKRADTILVSNEGYISTAGFLTNEAIVEVCRDWMEKLDWTAWKPRQPLTNSHTYALVANLYWQVLTQYINVFFDKHQAEILKEWREIHCLSDDLVEHSVACNIEPKNGSQSQEDLYDWYDFNELEKTDIPRAKINGILKAIRPITLSDRPSTNDLENLKQFCRYVIFHTTFWHSWVNDRQPDEAGEIAYSCLALRNGSFGSEDDPNIAPPPSEATQLLFLMHTLSEIKYGYLLKNEDGDIPPEFRTILLQFKGQFAQLGFDANNIRSLINI